MANPMIAILGCVDKRREQELALSDTAMANTAAEQLGAESAQRGWHILVSCPSIATAEFAEAPVVRGYVKSGKAGRDSIEVHRPVGSTLPRFPEESTHAGLFRFELRDSDDWAVASFLSLANADGMIVIGGGESTYIASLVGIGYRTPIVALAAFGGKAKEIWAVLKSSDNRLATAAEMNHMAQPGWAADSARRCVDMLLAQRARKEEGIALVFARERKRVSVLAASVFLSFLAILVVMAHLSRSEKLGLAFSYSMLCLPAVAGAVGSLVRLLFDWAQGNKTLASQPSPLISASLGAVAGGVAGLFFVLAQKVAIGNFQDSQAVALLPFVFIVGLVSGLTLDKVFPKLLALDVVKTEALEAKPAGASTTAGK